MKSWLIGVMLRKYLSGVDHIKMMSQITQKIRRSLRRYLLGQLTREARQVIEQAILSSAEVYEELLIIEEELVDQYIAEDVTPDERSTKSIFSCRAGAAPAIAVRTGTEMLAYQERCCLAQG